MGHLYIFVIPLTYFVCPIKRNFQFGPLGNFFPSWENFSQQVQTQFSLKLDDKTVTFYTYSESL